MLQLLVYGIISGSIITLGAIGLSLTYGILGFANFAHGDIMTLGAYFALAFLGLFSIAGIPSTPIGPLSFGLSMILAIVLSMILTALVAIILDKVIYRKLRKRNPIILLIAAVGVSFIIRNLIQLFWGPDIRYYTKKIQIMDTIPWLGVKIKPDQIFILFTSLILVVSLHLFLKYAKMGKAMRAAADNMELAKVSGIDTEKVILWTWAIGTVLAAAAGILVGIENGTIIPSLGWNMLLPLFAAVILGGIGNPYGAMLGGMLIGISEEVSTMFISTAYKPAIAFGILIIMLMVRPKGLLGDKG